ncbi:unnamed protein product [Darwinula stevensoni]|uniref:Uncharacterized protein n=1 Tax=Darwinula stevensoni TaxID=69355 RepID=A0A7R9AAQ4_9CRUS|nr:unnamed protein product [Darwinula stevensoni]CAG0898675.1 unnamed protein product [Darwinula stevensoni]
MNGLLVRYGFGGRFCGVPSVNLHANDVSWYAYADVDQITEDMNRRPWSLLGLLVVLLLGMSHADNTKTEENLDAQELDGGRQSRGLALFGLMKEVVARATTTSEVLTLNLTNLVILLVLKGILIAIGIAGGFGFGGLFGGRSFETKKSFFQTDDLRWMMTYMIGTYDADYSCLNLLACLDPDNAHEYVMGAKLMIKGGKAVSDFSRGWIPYNTKYEQIVRDLQAGAEYAGQCERKYHCDLKLF